MINWIEEKENLEKYILQDNISYEEIGRMYGCSGANVKKQAKKLGIELPQRRKINDSETFNKGTGKKNYCLNCGKEIPLNQKYCSNKCQMEYTYKVSIEKWKSGEDSGTRKNNEMAQFVRRYMFEKYNGKCQKCGWGEINPITGNIPLEVHHIDGDCSNNHEDNLQLLCPNCHSLTENFGSLNKNSKRYFYLRNK